MDESGGKKRRREKHSITTFSDDWIKTWPCLRRGKDRTQALCSVCNRGFSVAHQGKRDVERHINGAEHKRLAKEIRECRSVRSFFNDPIRDKVVNAEVLYTGYILEHNLPFESAAHAGPLFRKMFPDSQIAKQYGCAATKTAAIINYAMAPSMRTPVVESLKQHPFSIAVGSSDTGTESMYPLVVRIFDINRKEVSTKFWHMCYVSDSSARGIFSQIEDAFIKYDVPWKNAIGLSLDNASVNMGRHNGLYTHFEKKNPGIYTAGCPCHIIHNTAGFAAKHFTEATGFDVDDLLVDLYYFFDKSTKRQASLKEFCEFCDQEYRKILKFGATRWLSREICLNRVLQQYPSLESFFASQPERGADARLRRLQKAFADPRTEIYLLFLQSVLPLFTDINKLLQSEEPKCHLMLKELTSFMQKLFGRFLDISAFRDQPVQDVDPCGMPLSDDDLMVGFTTRMAMQKHNLLPREVHEMLDGCRKFFIAACEYAQSHLPFTNDLLKHAEVLQFPNRQEISFDSVVYFVERFAGLKGRLATLHGNASYMDALYDQVTTYKLLPDDIDGVNTARVDTMWADLSQLKQADGVLRFNLLFEVVRHILVLPHSNAEEERIFSDVSKNRTKFRASLSNKTLPAILTCKTNCFNKLECYRFSPSKELLQEAKKAAGTYNKEHTK